MAGDEIVLEVRRTGRRPRYHRGARQAGTGVRLDAPQCNVDQAGAGVRVLEELPTPDELGPNGRPLFVRPWSQLCRRCWAGTDALLAAALDYARWRERTSA